MKCTKCGREVKVEKKDDKFCAPKCELEHALRTTEDGFKEYRQRIALCE